MYVNKYNYIFIKQLLLMNTYIYHYIDIMLICYYDLILKQNEADSDFKKYFALFCFYCAGVSVCIKS